MTTPTPGDAALPALVQALGTFHEVRAQLIEMASTYPDIILLYLKTVPLDFSEIPGGDLLRDLEAVASGTLQDATAQSSRSARH